MKSMTYMLAIITLTRITTFCRSFPTNCRRVLTRSQIVASHVMKFAACLLTPNRLNSFHCSFFRFAANVRRAICSRQCDPPV